MKTWIFFATALSFYPTENFGKIILTEIMADPSPNLGFIPETEYLEIYNSDSTYFSLKNFVLKIGNTSLLLPDYSLSGGEYLILTKSLDSLANNQLILSRFPALNNTGTSISLSDTLGSLIFSVNYTDKWYQESSKKSGGWSLELIDFEKPIECMNNWIAHPGEKGGSPGYRYFFDPSYQDQTPPFAENPLIESDQSLKLIFSEPMNSKILAEPENYFWVEEKRHPETVLINEKEALLIFDKTLQRGILNTLELYSSIQDCMGNSLIDTTLEFGNGKIPEIQDLLINEIMFDPLSSCPTYIEIINNTQEYLELNDFELQFDQNEKAISLPSKFLEPKNFYVLTKDILNLKKCHSNWRVNSEIQISNYSLRREKGQISLLFMGKEVEKIQYSNDWHHPFLDPTRGVSLERLSLSRSGEQSSNWHSASIPTPGFTNSQSIDLKENKEFIQLSSQVISPNGDGDNDFLIIQYQPDRPGYLLNIYLFDENGISLGFILNQERISTIGQIIWNGTEESGTILNPGLFILMCRWTHPDGEVLTSKHLIHLDY